MADILREIESRLPLALQRIIGIYALDWDEVLQCYSGGYLSANEWACAEIVRQDITRVQRDLVLAAACAREHTQVLKIFSIDKRISPRTVHIPYSAISPAVAHGNLYIARWVLRYIESFEWTIEGVKTACAFGHIEVAKLLASVAPCNDIQAELLYIVLIAHESGHYHVADWVICTYGKYQFTPEEALLERLYKTLDNSVQCGKLQQVKSVVDWLNRTASPRTISYS